MKANGQKFPRFVNPEWRLTESKPAFAILGDATNIEAGIGVKETVENSTSVYSATFNGDHCAPLPELEKGVSMDANEVLFIIVIDGLHAGRGVGQLLAAGGGSNGGAGGGQAEMGDDAHLGGACVQDGGRVYPRVQQEQRGQGAVR